MGQWFKTKEFTTLEIEEFKSISIHKVVKSKIIQDTSLIQSLVEQIEQIDPNGDMMVSWGPDAAYLTLTFTNEKERDVIEIVSFPIFKATLN